MHDYLIRNATIVDGTGAAPFTGDIALADGRIVEVGDVSGAAKETLDAHGAIAAPGWVDVHTHYDGQVSWDEELRPSVNFGVTSALLGNCGVGFAPMRKGDEDAEETRQKDGRQHFARSAIPQCDGERRKSECRPEGG